MRLTTLLLFCLFLITLIFSQGCGSDDSDTSIDGDMTDGDTSDGDETDGDAEPDGDAEADNELDGDEEEADIPQGPFYDPWMVMPTSELAPRRDFRIVRGIIHSHSPYSHDACDDEPFIDGVRNEQCFEDCRNGMCQTYQDFVFMTDHHDLFADYEFPEVLLYKDGDRLIEREGLPVANRVECGDDHSVIMAAGTESEMMPIGLEHHVGETPAERHPAYTMAGPEGIGPLQEAGALVFLQHTEGWSVESVVDWPIDGIEVYNLHQNLMDNMGAALAMILRLETEPERLPVIELGIMAVFQESEADLYRWALAAAEKKISGALATDAHRNVFNGDSPDGERIDSFRRMMHWFSNYVMVPASATGDALDDAVLKEAISHGRMYGGFDFLGYPIGFDCTAHAGEAVYEMGDVVEPIEGAEIHMTLPHVWKLDPEADAPAITGRILKADADGSWTEVAAGESDLSVSVGSGAYRCEARIIPYHLREWLGTDGEQYLEASMPWVYGNVIYIGEPGE